MKFATELTAADTSIDSYYLTGEREDIKDVKSMIYLLKNLKAQMYKKLKEMKKNGYKN